MLCHSNLTFSTMWLKQNILRQWHFRDLFSLCPHCKKGLSFRPNENTLILGERDTACPKSGILRVLYFKHTMTVHFEGYTQEKRQQCPQLQEQYVTVIKFQKHTQYTVNDSRIMYIHQWQEPADCSLPNTSKWTTCQLVLLFTNAQILRGWWQGSIIPLLTIILSPITLYKLMLAHQINKPILKFSFMY